jgi:hypothetical protein
MMPPLSAVIDLANQLDVLRVIKGKLLRQPDAAAERLVIVLEELSKIYTAIESELVEYLSLYFDNDSAQAERAVLLRLEGGEISSRASAASGHCHKIKNIYDRFLDPWFQKVLSRGEIDNVRKLFELLGDFDRSVVVDLDVVARWLTQEATATLNLVNAKKYDYANDRICTARKEVLPVRQAITNAIIELRKLQAEFIGSTGVI